MKFQLVRLDSISRNVRTFKITNTTHVSRVLRPIQRIPIISSSLRLYSIECQRPERTRIESPIGLWQITHPSQMQNSDSVKINLIHVDNTPQKFFLITSCLYIPHIICRQVNRSFPFPFNDIFVFITALFKIDFFYSNFKF